MSGEQATLAVTIAGVVIWAVRQEGRINTQEEIVKRIETSVDRLVEKVETLIERQIGGR